MSRNVVTSDAAAPKPAKKTATKAEPKIKKVVNDRDKVIATAPDGYKFVYFSSGVAYVTADGFRFTKDNPIYLLPVEEADRLLKLDNFRLPDQLELEDYAKEN